MSMEDLGIDTIETTEASAVDVASVELIDVQNQWIQEGGFVLRGIGASLVTYPWGSSAEAALVRVGNWAARRQDLPELDI